MEQKSIRKRVNRGSLFFAYIVIRLLHISLVKHVLVPVISEVHKRLLDKGHRLGICLNLVSVAQPVLKCLLGLIVLAEVGLRRGDLIAHALNCILVRHHRRCRTVGVDPIFKVVLVASLVVQPRKAHALFTAAYPDRRSKALVIFCALEKLSRRKL